MSKNRPRLARAHDSYRCRQRTSANHGSAAAAGRDWNSAGTHRGQIAGSRYEALQNRAQYLLEETGKPSFWDDNDRARQILSTIYQIERVTDRFINLRNRAEQLTEVARMIRRNNDFPGLARLGSNYEELERATALAELELFAGEGDSLAADVVFLKIAPVSLPRARDAGDWPEMLASMYLKWAARKGHEIEAIHEPGTNPILLVRGPKIEAMLGGEVGLHKLQREDGSRKERGRAGTQVQLARVEILSALQLAEAAPDGDARILQIIGGSENHAVKIDGSGRGETRETKDHYLVVEARDLLLSLQARQESGMPASEELVRVYHLTKAQYVRDPRTGERSNRPREVLDGALDAFLLAYLKQKAEILPGELPGAEDGADSSSRRNEDE